MKLTNSKVVRGKSDEQNKTNNNQDLTPEPENEKKKSKINYINKQKHSDVPVIDDFEWKSIPLLDSSEPMSSLSEKFFKDDILQFICNESLRYAKNKGNHSNQLELHDLSDLMIYPYLANNTSFVPNGKFSKVQPLLNKLNKQCLSNYLPEKQ